MGLLQRGSSLLSHKSLVKMWLRTRFPNIDSSLNVSQGCVKEASLLLLLLCYTPPPTPTPAPIFWFWAGVSGKVAAVGVL